MLIVSPELNCSNEILTIAAMMSGMVDKNFTGVLLIYLCPVPNIWLHPNNQRREADAAKARLTTPDGDHITLLNVYNRYRLQGEKNFPLNILELTVFLILGFI
jgi:pre-mRNA-splicing factor ATP-dependent RNA helicase DHX15/PRP43